MENVLNRFSLSNGMEEKESDSERICKCKYTKEEINKQ